MATAEEALGVVTHRCLIQRLSGCRLTVHSMSVSGHSKHDPQCALRGRRIVTSAAAECRRDICYQRSVNAMKYALVAAAVALGGCSNAGTSPSVPKNPMATTKPVVV